MSFSITVDKSKLEQLMKDMPGNADQVLGKVAFDGQADIQRNFNTVSPSPVGETPGIVSGNLKNKIEVEHTGPLDWRIVAATEYAAPLEYGFHIKTADGYILVGARPFMRPAAQRIAKTLPIALKAIVKIK